MPNSSLWVLQRLKFKINQDEIKFSSFFKLFRPGARTPLTDAVLTHLVQRVPPDAGDATDRDGSGGVLRATGSVDVRAFHPSVSRTRRGLEKLDFSTRCDRVEK